jgi:hypothetical protein
MLPLTRADDESMSSGDESDDMDLTEGSSYESDAAEWVEGRLSNIVVLRVDLPSLLKVTPRRTNILLLSVTPGCLGITAFQRPSLPYGSTLLLSPFK